MVNKTTSLLYVRKFNGQKRNLNNVEQGSFENNHVSLI